MHRKVTGKIFQNVRRIYLKLVELLVTFCVLPYSFNNLTIVSNNELVNKLGFFPPFGCKRQKPKSNML